MRSRARIAVAGACIVLLMAAAALAAGEALQALVTPRLDITDAAGRVRASLRCNADGRVEIVSYAEEGTEDGRVLLAELMAASAKAASISAATVTAASPASFDRIREVDAKRAAAVYGTKESLDLLMELTALWRDLPVAPGDVTGEAARERKLREIGMEFINESLAYTNKTGKMYTPPERFRRK